MSAEKNTNTDRSNIPESTLLALRNGDHDAYREVYVHFKEPVEQFIYRLTRLQDVAEEIAQDIFINVWERRGSIDPAKSIKSYLFTIAKNSALNYIEKKKVREKYSDLTQKYSPSGEANTDQLIAAQETSLLIDIAIARMPSIRANVFRMNHYDGLSNDEIADKLDMSKGTVATHLAHARKDIKGILNLWVILVRD